MGRYVTVSLAQMDLAWGQPEANLNKADGLTAEARRRGSDIIVFPELFTTAYDLSRAGRYATVPGEGAWARLAELARQQAIYLTGSLLKGVEGAITNCAPLFSPQGECLGEYEKIHLFPPMEETCYLSPGSRTPVFDLPWGRCAIAICYDLRFPELFRKYALAGAEMVFMLAEWPFPRLEHWRTLLRARAIENQSFYVACNRVGQGGETRFCGHSAVIDPRGQAVVEAGDTEVLLTVTVDMEEVKVMRSQWTVLQDRRPDIY